MAGQGTPGRVDPGERHRPCCPGSDSGVNVARGAPAGARRARGC